MAAFTIEGGTGSGFAAEKTRLDRRTLMKTAALSAAMLAPGAALADENAPTSPTPTAAANLRRTSSMSTGAFSEDRLARMRETMLRSVESARLPGLVTLVHRRGETHVDAIGTMAFDSPQPMQRDTIFRVASITKPVTAVAAMILVEEAKLRLDDPVDPFLPELADRKVLRTIESPLDDTVPANRPISLRDLLTFRLGHGAVMVFPPKYPIQQATMDAGVAAGPILAALPPDELMKAYGSLPLLHQPGEEWHYNSGSDILGVLISRVAGKSLGAFMKERIFDPLGMKDTGFSVPPEKLARLPACYSTDFATGNVVVFDDARGRFASPPPLESGAGGLVSTADDYLAFCRMMLNKGGYDNERILSRRSVELMTTDHITLEQKVRSVFFADFWENRGWGFGMSVITARRNLEDTPGRFGWDGGYGTSAYIDPAEEMIGILMTQRIWDSPSAPAVLTDFWTSAYQAMEG